MHGTFEIAKKARRPFDWSMAVLIGLAVAYGGGVAGAIMTGASILQ